MHLGVTWPQAGAVVLSAIGIYLSFLVLIKVAGQRALASMSSFDFAAAVAFGAVVGRVVLGDTPTLEAGIIGLATLFCLQGAFSLVRRSRRVDALLSNLPLLLMAEGRILEDNLRAARMVESELQAKLRLAGVRRYEDVACAILERTGAVSVLRRGDTISARLLGDVRGREALTGGTLE